MRRWSLWLALAALAALRCGPPPAQVAGNYTGQESLVLGGTSAASGSQVVNVTQSGGELSFSLSQCAVKAFADSANSFRVGDFKCTRYLGSQSWILEGTGKVSANTNSINVAINGTGKSGALDSPFTWSFLGSRAP
ncbi:MAG: hypothetical protein ACYC8T_34455 [Myxococcaceae bacterium]